MRRKKKRTSFLRSSPSQWSLRRRARGGFCQPRQTKRKRRGDDARERSRRSRSRSRSLSRSRTLSRLSRSPLGFEGPRSSSERFVSVSTSIVNRQGGPRQELRCFLTHLALGGHRPPIAFRRAGSGGPIPGTLGHRGLQSFFCKCTSADDSFRQSQIAVCVQCLCV